jgi:hypothetical protein
MLHPTTLLWPTGENLFLLPPNSYSASLLTVLFLANRPNSSLSVFTRLPLYAFLRYLPHDSIAAHSDDEPLLRPFAPIFSASWGAPRRFVLKGNVTPPHGADAQSSSAADIQSSRSSGPGSKSTAASRPPLDLHAVRFEVELRHGDLLVMGGACQATHRHELPAPKKARAKSKSASQEPLPEATERGAEPEAAASPGLEGFRRAGMEPGCRVNITIRSSAPLVQGK